jgi:hypothetical protein
LPRAGNRGHDPDSCSSRAVDHRLILGSTVREIRETEVARGDTGIDSLGGGAHTALGPLEHVSTDMPLLRRLNADRLGGRGRCHARARAPAGWPLVGGLTYKAPFARSLSSSR